MEANECRGADPIEQLYAAIAAESRRKVLEQPYDASTMRYERRPSIRFRASESGNCPRRIWYRLMGFVPTPDDPSLVLKQLEGNISQDVIRGLFQQYGIPVRGIVFEADGAQTETLDGRKEFEVPMDDGSAETVLVSARADGDLDAAGEPAVFEFKTMAKYAVKWLQAAFAKGGVEAALEYLHQKRRYYITQMQITMAVFKFKRTYFNFKDKDTTDYGLVRADGSHCGLVLEYDDGMVQKLLRKFADVKRYVLAEKEIPFNAPDVPLDGSMECGYCPFYYRCYAAQSRGGRVIYPGMEAAA